MENSVSSKSFKERCKEWKSTTDFESVRCVFNILPDEFRKRVENNTFYNCIYNHRTTKTNQKYPSVNL